MKIKELENRRNEKMVSFKDFYEYFKKSNYNTTLLTIKRMYEIYVK